jgi:hypothetical protein
MRLVSDRRRFRPMLLGLYESSRIARLTASVLAGWTLETPLITRDTVATDTPARFATSEIVAIEELLLAFGTLLCYDCNRFPVIDYL